MVSNPLLRILVGDPDYTVKSIYESNASTTSVLCLSHSSISSSFLHSGSTYTISHAFYVGSQLLSLYCFFLMSLWHFSHSIRMKEWSLCSNLLSLFPFKKNVSSSRQRWWLPNMLNQFCTFILVFSSTLHLINSTDDSYWVIKNPSSTCSKVSLTYIALMWMYYRLSSSNMSVAPHRLWPPGEIENISLEVISLNLTTSVGSYFLVTDFIVGSVNITICSPLSKPLYAT